jgi:hypothetical protein
MPPTEPTTAATQGRDSQGRFTKGNPGGPGNPHARQVAALRQRLLQRVTTEELDAIIDTLLALARQGDVAAAKLIFQYTLGKPLEARDPDRLDADEVDAFRANAFTSQTMDLLKLYPVELFLPLLRILIDAKGTGNLQEFADQFRRKFGSDGVSGSKAGKQEAAPPQPTAPAAEQTAPPQAAQPKKATVSKRKQTGPSLPMGVLQDILPEGLLDAAAFGLPGLGTPPPESNREPAAERTKSPSRCLPPSPPDEAGRQQTERNGNPRGYPDPSRTRAAPTAA